MNQFVQPGPLPFPVTDPVLKAYLQDLRDKIFERVDYIIRIGAFAMEDLENLSELPGNVLPAMALKRQETNRKMDLAFKEVYEMKAEYEHGMGIALAAGNAASSGESEEVEGSTDERETEG